MIRDAYLTLDSNVEVTATASAQLCTNVIDLGANYDKRRIWSGENRLKPFFAAVGAASGNTNNVTVKIYVHSTTAVGSGTLISSRTGAAIANSTKYFWEIPIPPADATRARYLGFVYAITGSGAAFTITEAGFTCDHPTNIPGAVTPVR